MVNWNEIRQQHLLGDGEIYLNTGSFGSLHRRTFDDYMALLREFEANPTMNHPVFWEHADSARDRLATFLGSPAPDLAFTSNAVSYTHLTLPTKRIV